jgi:hypothetical protein
MMRKFFRPALPWLTFAVIVPLSAFAGFAFCLVIGALLIAASPFVAVWMLVWSARQCLDAVPFFLDDLKPEARSDV